MSPDPKLTSGGRGVSLLLLGNVIVGVGVPLIVASLAGIDLTVEEGALVSLLAVLVLTLAEMLYKIEQMRSQYLSELETWDRRQAVDDTLSRVRAGLHQLVLDEDLRDSFYLDHYQRDLELLVSRVQASLNTKEIQIERHHIDSTEVLLSIYDRKEHSIFRATHCLSDITDSFDPTFRVYFHAWLERLKSRKVKEFRRLFIVDSAAQFDHVNTRKLIAFHNSKTRGLVAKLVQRNELHRFKSDYQIDDGVDDFGIFSDEYIYLGKTRKDDNISGSFGRDKALIANYTHMYDALWNSQSATDISQAVPEAIDVKQLFDPHYSIPLGGQGEVALDVQGVATNGPMEQIEGPTSDGESGIDDVSLEEPNE